MPASVRRRRILYKIADHVVLIGFSLLFLLPILFMFLTALMTDDQALTTKIIPDPWMWSNFRTVFDQVDMWLYTKNTLLYAGLSTVGVLVSCVPVAYAFSRVQWRGRNIVFLGVLSTLMLPSQVTSVSLYIIFAKHMGWTGMEWIGTLKPLIVPSFFGDAFSIFLLRQFFMTIPQELCDSVRVDGGGDIQILRKVILPLSKPALMAVGLFNFIYCWNNFYDPLVYVGQNPQAQVLSLALSTFKTQHHVQWNLTMAAAVIFMIPVIIIFFLAQRVFIEGIQLSGVKG